MARSGASVGHHIKDFGPGKIGVLVGGSRRRYSGDPRYEANSSITDFMTIAPPSQHRFAHAEAINETRHASAVTLAHASASVTP